MKDEAPIVGSINGKPVRFEWSGRTSRTHPHTDVALLYWVLGPNTQVLMRATREQLATLRRQIKHLEDWMKGDDYASFRK